LADGKEKAPTGSEEEKMLGAFVPASLYWLFKNVAAQRREKMQEAIITAAYLYIDAIEGGENGCKTEP
jgi:hypothetical protein